MPYARNSELPQAVRNALPPRAQRVFRSAFNGASKRGLSDSSSFAEAWAAVKSGFKKDPSGKWVKKIAEAEIVVNGSNFESAFTKAVIEALTKQPDMSQVHRNRPLGSDGKKKKKKPSAVACGDLVALSFEIIKNADGSPAVDEDQKLVFGWLSVIEEGGKQVEDLQGHVIDESTLEAAAYDMVMNGCDAGEMHERIGIGDGLVECMMFTKAKQQALGIDLGKVGLWVGFRVDADAFAKVKSGELKAFSLGGRGLLEDIPEAA